MSNLSITRARELLDYEPTTGVITWKVGRGRHGGAAPQGSRAGHDAGGGYLVVTVDGKGYRAHRIAWFIVHGQWPDRIDHLNGDKMDNRLSNLRACSVQVNNENRRAAQKNNRSSGLLGVTLCRRRQKWIAQIGVGGKVKKLGRFETPELAHASYLAAKRVLHSGCTI